MKNIFPLSLLLLLILFIGFTACTKQNETTAISSEDEINALAEKAITGMDAQEVYSDNPDMGIYMENDGIPHDFLVEENDLEDNDTLRAGIRKHSFIACLHGLDLTQTQVRKIKSDIKSYSECKENAVQRAKAIYHELHEKYKEKYQRIYTAFQNGTISREKFKALMAELRVQFHKELRSLHLKEKLDEAFRQCFRIFLKNLHSILTEKQWNAFVGCYKR